MSDRNIVFAHTQREFQRALEIESEEALVVLNADGTYVIPVVRRSTLFPEVVVRDEAALIGGHLPMHVTVFDGGEISVEDVASVRADTDGRVNVADTPKVTVLSASGVAVRNCEMVVVRKGISVVAYDCGRVNIEEETDVADA